MFENILGYETLVQQLRKDIEGEKLPSAILFSGPQFGGKLSLALEIARGLSCRETGQWNCSCIECRKNRFLYSSNLLLLGSRYFMEEIRASLDCLLRKDMVPSRFMFLRSVRKLLRRFDTVLWEGEEAKVSKVTKLIPEIEELLTSLSPDMASRSSLVPEELERIVKSAETLAKALPSTIPVNMVRKVSYWTRLGSDGAPKVVIIENSETLQDSSRNALLKILEEPPARVFFILLTRNKGANIQTILSRVRHYPLGTRTVDSQQQVLQKIFRIDEAEQISERSLFTGLGDFFHQFSESGAEELNILARHYVTSLLKNLPYDSVKESANGEKVELPHDASQAVRFLEALTGSLRAVLLGEDSLRADFQPHPHVLSLWNQGLLQAKQQIESLRMNPALVLETLFLDMRKNMVQVSR